MTSQNTKLSQQRHHKTQTNSTAHPLRRYVRVLMMVVVVVMPSILVVAVRGRARRGRDAVLTTTQGQHITKGIDDYSCSLEQLW